MAFFCQTFKRYLRPGPIFVVLIALSQWMGATIAQYSDAASASKILLHVGNVDDENTLLLGALFPVHDYKSFSRLGGQEETHVCDGVKFSDGIQGVEGFLFSLDQVNNDPSLLPGITLGGLVLDSCNSPKVALNRSISFINGYLANRNAHHSTEFNCSDGSRPSYLGGRFDKVVGVIGGQKSAVSVQMANVFKLFEIPQVSYLSTAATLSNQELYPYFLRTVPPDNEQAEVILRIMQGQNWKYASLVYAKGDYGEGGRRQLEVNSERFGVCFAEPVHALSSSDSDSRYREVAESLTNNTNAKVVVLFAHLDVAMRLLGKVDALQHGVHHGKIFLGSDGWTNRPLEKSFARVAENTIAVQPKVVKIPEFDSYMEALRPETHKSNPWFNEFWESHFKCSLQYATGGIKLCRKNLSLSSSNGYHQSGWLHFLRDAVYAYATALHDLWLRHCNGQEGVCEAMTHQGHIHGNDLLQALKNVTFTDVSGQPFQFDSSRSGLPRYTVFQFKHHDNDSYSWVPVANYSKHVNSEPRLTWFEENGLWSHGEAAPTSYCSVDCTVGQAKITKGRCCWECLSCTEQQFLNTSRGQDSSFCDMCDVCDRPNGTECVPKDANPLGYNNHWVVTATVFASFGILTTLCVAGLFGAYLHTPVIRAASRELSFILLTGILLSFCMTFVIVAPATKITCGITRFFLGFSYTLCYAAILTKTNRIARIFKSPAKALKAKYTSPNWQMLIVLALVSVEVAINVTWLVYTPPAPDVVCDIKLKHNILVCQGIKGYSYLVGLLYPLLLVFLCTIYAIKTRKCPGGFNEARYIAFTNYTTCIIWVVFVPLYLTKDPSDETRVVSLAMSLSLGGFVQLGCLFLPKVHLVVFKPDKNTRDVVMSQQSGASSGGGRGIKTGPHHNSAPAAVMCINGVNSRTNSMQYPDPGYDYSSMKRRGPTHPQHERPLSSTPPLQGRPLLSVQQPGHKVLGSQLAMGHPSQLQQTKLVTAPQQLQQQSQPITLPLHQNTPLLQENPFQQQTHSDGHSSGGESLKKRSGKSKRSKGGSHPRQEDGVNPPIHPHALAEGAESPQDLSELIGDRHGQTVDPMTEGQINTAYMKTLKRGQ